MKIEYGVVIIPKSNETFKYIVTEVIDNMVMCFNKDNVRGEPCYFKIEDIEPLYKMSEEDIESLANYFKKKILCRGYK